MTDLNTWILKKHGASLKSFDDFKVPWLWRKFALDAVTLKGNSIYFRNVEKLSDTGYTALLFHEGFHAQSQRKIGWTRYVVKYALSPSFRAAEEVEAYLRQIEYWYVASGVVPARDLTRRVPGMLVNSYLLKSKREWIEDAIDSGLTQIIIGSRRPVRNLLEEYERANKCGQQS